MIYNNFLYKYIRKEVDLTGDTFKIALFTSDYSPKTDDETYTIIAQTGAEISGTGYDKGGKSFKFYGPVEVADDNKLYYTGTNVTWTNATFYGARYAVIYRVSKEAGEDILVAYYDFGDDKKVSKGNFKLSWKDKYVLILSLNNITINSSGSYNINVDNKLDDTSTNPVQNKALADVIGALGVRFEDEEVPNKASAVENEIDVLKKISEEDIVAIITGETPDEPDEPDVDPDPTPSGVVDSIFDYDSSNSVENKVLSDAFAEMGVLLNKEDVPESADALDGKVDTLREMEASEIDAIFNKATPFSIFYVIQKPDFISFMGNYTVNKKVTLPSKNIGLTHEDEDYVDVNWYSNSKCTQPYYIGKSGEEVSIARIMTLYGVIDG